MGIDMIASAVGAWAWEKVAGRSMKATGHRKANEWQIRFPHIFDALDELMAHPPQSGIDQG